MKDYIITIVIGSIVVIALFALLALVMYELLA